MSRRGDRLFAETLQRYDTHHALVGRTVSVVEAAPDWRVISSRDFHEKIYATPAPDHDRIYLRTEQALYCFKGK